MKLTDRFIYFDNAADSQLDSEVVKVMEIALQEECGNPSSIHQFGRQIKVKIEESRAFLAQLIHSHAGEIIFTSGATEANNAAIQTAILHLGVKNVITSKLEHVSVLKTLHAFQSKGLISIHYVDIDKNGRINLDHLNHLLKHYKKTFVSLMHANNEISNLLPIKSVSKLCREHDALFHSNMAQTFGKFHIDFESIDVDFASCSGHKFHGPKGIGFLYVNSRTVKMDSILYGGIQEHGKRGGTENVYGILGIQKAFEIAYSQMENNQKKIADLKKYMVDRLLSNFENIQFLGDSKELGLYSILNVLFSCHDFPKTLILNLDIEGIAVSHGSITSTEFSQQSHVIDALGIDKNFFPVRFSFSKYNTLEEVDICIEILKKYYRKALKI